MHVEWQQNFQINWTVQTVRVSV